MTLGHGPKIATNGLVFAYDMDSIRSYNGPQTTNSATGIVPVYNTETSLFTMYPTYEDVYVPQIGWVRNCLAMTMYNDYNGGSGNCCPSPIVYYTGGNTTTNVKTSTLYTYAIVYKSTNGYTHPNFMYRYEYGPSGYLTEGGIHNTSNRIHLGNDWYWAWGTFTTQSATTNMTPRCFQYQYATWNKLYLAKVMLIEGNYTGLHPKFWPNLSETINSTNSVLDWTGNNTITANSLTYNSDGTFSFNGSSNYLSATVSFNLYCMDFWMYNNNAIPGNDGAIGGPTTYQSLIGFNNQSSIGVNLGGWTSSATNEAIHIWSGNGTSFTGMTYTRDIVPVGWHNVVFNWNGTTYDIWVDGIKSTVYASTFGHATLQAITNFVVGKNVQSNYFFNGKIAALKMYDQQLNDSDIQQNFNALRGRYGI